MQFKEDQPGADGVIEVEIKVEFMHNSEWMEVTAIVTTIRWVGSERAIYAAYGAGKGVYTCWPERV